MDSARNGAAFARFLRRGREIMTGALHTDLYQLTMAAAYFA
jgi:nicotinic acid phosphoribosyltransferase